MTTNDSKPTWNEVLKELRAEYLIVLPERLALIQELTEFILSGAPEAPGKTIHDLNREYHKLKGTGRTYGFPDVSTLCEKLEQLSMAHVIENETQLKSGPELLAYLIDSYQNDRVPVLAEQPAWQQLNG